MQRAIGYWYAFGYITRERAEEALGVAYSAGEVSLGENPRIDGYKNRNGETRFGIKLNEI